MLETIFVAVALILVPGLGLRPVVINIPFKTLEMCEDGRVSADIALESRGVKVLYSKCVAMGGEV
tara:strand:- start:318 stop:512 length:195 start_codon:yes stop_codon:yes gene_type:complete